MKPTFIVSPKKKETFIVTPKEVPIRKARGKYATALDSIKKKDKLA